MSIWTHLLGTVLFFVLMFTTLMSLPDNAADRLIFFAFFLGAQCQMLFSTLFHMFGCHSPVAYTWLAKLDYSGISLMIVGSYYPPMYYGFACDQTWRITYLVLISAFGVVGLTVSMIPIFSTSKYRLVRTGFFLVFGFFAIFPLPHMFLVEGFDFTWPLFWRELVMGALYVVGAFFYGSRVPERFFPGKFDFWFGSHVIWHFFTIAAALFQLWACLISYEQRLNFPCNSGSGDVQPGGTT